MFGIGEGVAASGSRLPEGANRRAEDGALFLPIFIDRIEHETGGERSRHHEGAVFAGDLKSAGEFYDLRGQDCDAINDSAVCENLIKFRESPCCTDTAESR